MGTIAKTFWTSLSENDHTLEDGHVFFDYASIPSRLWTAVREWLEKIQVTDLYDEVGPKLFTYGNTSMILAIQNGRVVYTLAQRPRSWITMKEFI